MKSLSLRSPSSFTYAKILRWFSLGSSAKSLFCFPRFISFKFPTMHGRFTWPGEIVNCANVTMLLLTSFKQKRNMQSFLGFVNHALVLGTAIFLFSSSSFDVPFSFLQCTARSVHHDTLFDAWLSSLLHVSPTYYPNTVSLSRFERIKCHGSPILSTNSVVNFS